MATDPPKRDEQSPPDQPPDPQAFVTAEINAAMQRVPPASAGMGSFEQRTVDHVQTLVDVLENLPPAKPSSASLVVQLCTPTLLAAKALYDLVAAVWDMIDKKEASIKGVLTTFLSIVFIAVSAWAWGYLKKAYDDAQSRKDPHHARLLKRAKRQLAEQRRMYGESDEDGAETTTHNH